MRASFIEDLSILITLNNPMGLLLSLGLFLCLCSRCLLSGSSLSSRSSSLSLSGRRLARTAGRLLLRILCHFGIKVNEFDEANLGSVTLTGTELDDTGVSTGTVADFLTHCRWLPYPADS